MLPARWAPTSFTLLSCNPYSHGRRYMGNWGYDSPKPDSMGFFAVSPRKKGPNGWLGYIGDDTLPSYK